MRTNINRRSCFLWSACGISWSGELLSASEEGGPEAAEKVLADAVGAKQIDAAALFVQRGERVFARHFGAAETNDAIFLLASISKPISVAALMKLHEEKAFVLDDPVSRFLPEFKEGGRDAVTVRHLLTHVSGLPDQLPGNARLRSRHAPLSEFVDAAIRTPLLFAPGERYRYSSMAILLASEIARRISGTPFPALVDETIFGPLGMRHSAMGIGRLDPDDLMRCQVESSAPESGAGDPATRSWDWNSAYWRNLGVPWGGAHGSAPDVACFLRDFLHPSGKALRAETCSLMIANHNAGGIRPRGLGFDLGPGLGGGRCSPRTFGHTGSTGTLCWSDPESDAVCVVLTTLPARAMNPHPRDLASARVAAMVSP